MVYGPVWVNNYSPKDKSATWMGILHSCTVFGMISGYIIAGITINFLQGFLNWRFAIQIQGIAEIPIAIMFFLEDENHIDVNISDDDERFERSLSLVSCDPGNRVHSDDIRNNIKNDSLDYPNAGNAPKSETVNAITIRHNKPINTNSFISQAIEVLSNHLYLSVTFGLCSIYFIVTGIQFWMKAYLIKIIHGEPIKVVLTFSFTTVTAPLAGILMGGAFADRYGGYKGNNTYKAIKMCAAFGFISFALLKICLDFLSLILVTVHVFTT